ncbi:GvpL/GvpF family gas vesicle protein [Microbacterium mangrovi]|uniref:GvpL/GvpF family gas vesicle protein n=1 Tax=Microbacterium mangrovi TaxID=1348253 RepID=UPI00068D0905|nr:GvpL/GvpF family gas vesicle protein [Microbacterium mangrovi]
MTDAAASGLYLYAVFPEPAETPSLGVGIRDAPLRVVSAAGLAAVVHDSDVAPLTGADADVKKWIVQHSEVVERVWALADTVLPAGFNVIVAPGEDESAEERLRGWLSDSAASLIARLDALTGLVELRVEIALDQHVVAQGDSNVTELRTAMAGRPPGVRRLLQKKLDILERDAADRLANDLHPKYRARLAEHCEDLVENRRAHPPKGFVSVLTVALLADREAVESVGSVLAAIRSEQPAAEVSFIGPWPPYSFTDSLGEAWTRTSSP